MSAGKIGCAVLGATGVVGQRFVAGLQGHPTFQLRSLVGNRSAGKPYAEAVRWRLPGSPPDLPIEALEAMAARRDVKVVFSALPSGTAGPIESRLAAQGFQVFTNARDHRMDPDVPLLVPEINADHLELVRRQRGPGWIVANGNCTSIVLELPLAALHRAFGVESAVVTALQGLSGAGYPGVSALDVVDNVVPLIPGEEEKLQREPQKTLGRLSASGVEPASIPIAPTCTRVPVLEGHTLVAQLRLQRAPKDLEAVTAALDGFQGPALLRGLHTAPKKPIHVHRQPDRPQPRLDRDLEGGMAVSVGRLRLEGRELRLVALGHNTLRGAAGQSLLNAEYAHAAGYLQA